uniref:AAA domain-containing protein n=1 Tax=Rhabditophanes sp. KR3021 TaxID=114890 RepID=A0AC35U194_9BILA
MLRNILAVGKIQSRYLGQSSKLNSIISRSNPNILLNIQEKLNSIGASILLSSSRFTNRHTEAKKARLHKLKNEVDNNRGDGKESSSSNDDKEAEKDEDDQKREELKERIKKYFAISLLLYGLYVMTGTSDHSSEQITALSWNDFKERILPTGAVLKIIAYPERDMAYVYTMPGTKLKNGQDLKPVYSLGVPNMGKFESEIRRIEESLNFDPTNWTPIEYKRLDGISNLITMGILGLLVVGGYFLIKKSNISITSAMSQMTKGNYKFIDPLKKSKMLNIKFKDVAGLHEAKVEVMEFVEYLSNPGKFTKLGAKLPKGALFLGPPGCGKTLLAKALAAESSVPFISVNATEFIEMVGGLGASRVRSLFKEAKERAPCMIYIDEIDAIGRKRSDGSGSMGGGNSEQEQTLNQLLVEMDGIDSAKGIIVFASTNRPDMLDKALMRPGRLDRHVTVDLPTNLERIELFELYLGKIKLDKAPLFYAGRLAQMTPGMSGADIGNVVNEAALNAASNGRKIVTEKELNYAIERIIAGPEKRSRTLVKEEKLTVAYHEAGHALVGWLLEHTDALLKVTIVPRTSAALGFAQYTPRDRKLFSKEEMFDRMCMMLGGRAAENIQFGRITTGAQDDLSKVTKQAYAQMRIYGMNESIGYLSFPPNDSWGNPEFSPKPYGKKLAMTIDREAQALVAKAYFDTEKLIRANIDKLDIIAKELLLKEMLTYEDVKKLIGAPTFGEKNVIEMTEQILPKIDEP